MEGRGNGGGGGGGGGGIRHKLLKVQASFLERRVEGHH